jgi:hypothetical protein
MSVREHTTRFDPALIVGLDEPVQRYFTHAITNGAVLATLVRLTMRGRIKVGRWMEFTAEQRFADEHEFEWRAKAGWQRFKPLHVVDSYAGGAGGTVGKLCGRVPFLHAGDANTARAAAARAAAESVWVPASLLPQRGVKWQAEDLHTIVARFEVPPEHPEVRLRIDEVGAVQSVSLTRWGNVGQERFGYIPFGADVHAEQSFGDYTIPSRMAVGWWYGTPRFKPFFEAIVTSHELEP